MAAWPLWALIKRRHSLACKHKKSSFVIYQWHCQSKHRTQYDLRYNKTNRTLCSCSYPTPTPKGEQLIDITTVCILSAHAPSLGMYCTLAIHAQRGQSVPLNVPTLRGNKIYSTTLAAIASGGPDHAAHHFECSEPNPWIEAYVAPFRRRQQGAPILNENDGEHHETVESNSRHTFARLVKYSRAENTLQGSNLPERRY